MKKLSINIKSLIPWALLSFAFLVVFVWVFRSPILNYGGDIAEYHGITETIIKSKTLALTPVAEYNLRNYLQPSYYDNNPGYYVEGIDGKRYPVHFPLYSALATPIRLILHILSINELQTLRLTNVFILALTLIATWKLLVKNNYKRLVLLLGVFISPIMYFVSWPGPDVFYLSLLLVSTLCFFQRKYFLAAVITSIAALQSQPISFLAILQLGYAIYNYIKNNKFELKDLRKHTNFLLFLVITTGILAFPVLYNLAYFGTWSVWTKFTDGWTIIKGFGLQNISLKKLFEQFFDLNIGIFFYAPLLILAGFYFVFKFIKNKNVLFMIIAYIITALFFQTNPAWHYGTSGYGPTRHAIFLIPLFIVFFVFLMQKSWKHYLLLLIIALTQIPLMLMNGYVTPDITNSLKLTPIAQFVIEKWPSVYNPTPEIFVDRTNHEDIDYPTSAIYTKNGVCKKAYVLLSDSELLEKTCKNIPLGTADLLDDSMSRKSNITRITLTNEATFWPDPSSCGDGYEGPYKCMKTTEDFMKLTGITDSLRIENMENGVFKFKKGKIEKIKIPPGYFIQYHSIDGVYINF